MQFREMNVYRIVSFRSRTYIVIMTNETQGGTVHKTSFSRSVIRVVKKYKKI